MNKKILNTLGARLLLNANRIENILSFKLVLIMVVKLITALSKLLLSHLLSLSTN